MRYRVRVNAIDAFFRVTPRLAELCSQNGWPDADTLRVQVVEHRDGEAVCNVSFDEILVEGAGCVAGRVACWGRFRLRLDPDGRVCEAQREA